jgi:hypothetical protein
VRSTSPPGCLSGTRKGMSGTGRCTRDSRSSGFTRYGRRKVGFRPHTLRQLPVSWLSGWRRRPPLRAHSGRRSRHLRAGRPAIRCTRIRGTRHRGSALGVHEAKAAGLNGRKSVDLKSSPADGDGLEQSKTKGESTSLLSVGSVLTTAERPERSAGPRIPHVRDEPAVASGCEA